MDQYLVEVAEHVVEMQAVPVDDAQLIVRCSQILCYIVESLVMFFSWCSSKTRQEGDSISNIKSAYNVSIDEFSEYLTVAEP
jgi:hypothetical protein